MSRPGGRWPIRVLVPLLARPLAAHDVENLEALARHALNVARTQMRVWLSESDDESAHAYMIERAWQLSVKFKPAPGRSFQKYCFWILSRYSLTDWLRFERGRTRWEFSDHEHNRDK